MDLDSVAVLCALRTEGSISGAARALGLSRSTAWRRLNALEAELECRLVERTQRSNRLTSAGREVERRGRALLESAQAMREAAQAAHRGSEGVVRVAVPPIAAPLAVHALTFAQQLHPGLRVVAYQSPEVPDPLRDDYDLVVTFTPPEDEGLYIQRLATLEWGLFGAESYLAARGAPRDLCALSEHPLWMHYTPTDSTTQLPLLTGEPLEIEPFCATTSATTVKYAVERGLGLGFCPQLVGLWEVPIQRVLPTQVGRRRDAYMVAGLRQRESPRLQLAWRIMDEVQRRWLDGGAGGGPA